jgi:hypothetical protein
MTMAAGLLLSASSPYVQASVLNNRLRTILEGTNANKRNAETRKILRYATQKHLRLRPELVSLAVIEVGGKEPGVLSRGGKGSDQQWYAYIAAVNYEYNSRNTIINPTVELGGSFVLDSNSFEETTLSGAHIIYHGGPLHLENAKFANVGFDIDNTENGRKLAEALLASKDGTVSINLP